MQAIRKNQPSQPNLNQKPHGGSPPDQKPPMSTEPEVAVISFGKVKGSMGLSIVAAKVSKKVKVSIMLSSVAAQVSIKVKGITIVAGKLTKFCDYLKYIEFSSFLKFD